ncbi:MAG: 16S rRNA (cytidine(1402)-2'-O)-methyltransferase [Oscillospiraceae bacterium]|nr:16S rRNA (cytidine(1402)-2'-O)-methyltransferase [Oscillospiraceae bacterium]
MSGALYLVGTPIGNLGDFSPRAVEVLQQVDFIAAEDTRVSLKLLNRFEIKKPLVSYFEHNKNVSGEKILSRLMAGETCALVTDAGMPAISDPGEDIVRMCAEHNIDVFVVPGPSAVVSALAVSGLPTSRWCFEGFLSVNKKERIPHLESLQKEMRTMIFYEAPHKLLRTLEDMAEYFGGDRPIAVVREITKLHEQTLRTTIGGALAHFTETPPKGEFVLVVGGAPEETEEELTPEQALDIVARYREEGKSLKEACKLAAKDTGYSKNELYALALESK